jgi:hypothetical protein
VKQLLRLAALPIAAAAIMFGQSPIASADTLPFVGDPRSAPAVAPGQRVLVTRSATGGITVDRATTAICLECAMPQITAGMPDHTLFVSGTGFTAGHRVEVEIPSGFFGETILFDTIVTTSNSGTFELAHDLATDFGLGRISCGDVLDVAATDLAPLQSGLPAMAINVQTTACTPNP